MGEIEVAVLSEDDWGRYRAIRLTALQESPHAFAATHEQESGYDEDFWRVRMRRSRRLVAGGPDGDVGVVSLGQSEGAPGTGELFGLWVSPPARGTGVATALVQAAAEQAHTDGRSHLAYWVGTDNARAVGFASGFGFRPGEHRRQMRGPGHEDEQEIVMVLALGRDRGQHTSF